jgi:hypothetical protein
VAADRRRHLHLEQLTYREVTIAPSSVNLVWCNVYLLEENM